MSERPRFDLTISLSHILIVAGVLAGFVGSHYLTDYKLAVLQQQNTEIKAKLDSFSGLLIDAAVTAQRIRELERRLELAERR